MRTCHCNRVVSYSEPFEVHPEQCRACWEHYHSVVHLKNRRNANKPQIVKGGERYATPAPVSVPARAPTPVQPTVGPGTELKLMFNELGVAVSPSCDCNYRAAEMDRWGVDGCRERRTEIVNWLDEAQAKKSWAAKLMIGVKAVAKGWVNVTDPIGSLVDEAIRRAEEKVKHLAIEVVPVEAVPVIPQQLPAAKKLSWSYGVTTVPSRRSNLLPQTLNSLKAAGFDQPRLFIDGANARMAEGYEGQFKLPVTAHDSPLLTAGNWTLSLYELYIREPSADRYAIFQDDFVTYLNLKGYLDRCKYPEKGYWNLYTFPSNQRLAKGTGWYLSNQQGRGAVGLVFNRDAVIVLLSSLHLVERPQNVARGHKSIDGGIVTAMKKAGWSEYVHNPSLVQHTGDVSAMRNAPHLKAESFRGENFDALTLFSEVGV